MMDYYSTFPGPSKEEAIKTVVIGLENNFYEENMDFINNNKKKELEKMIFESINESIDILYKDSKECPFSLTGWSVFGIKDCKEKSKKLLKEKINYWKKNYLLNTFISLQLKKILDKKNLNEDYFNQIIKFLYRY